MNALKLASLYRNNRAAQIYFDTFAKRRRSFKETTIQDVVDLARRQGWGLPPDAVIEFFAALEEADCGQFVRDDKGARFEWLLKASQVALLARQTPAPKTDEKPEQWASQNIVHTLRLRPDWMLSLELPSDFTPAEAKRLCHFVRSLPLSPNEMFPLPNEMTLSPSDDPSPPDDKTMEA